eukprot:492426-Pyramimonas_sp.AAC.1
MAEGEGKAKPKSKAAGGLLLDSSLAGLGDKDGSAATFADDFVNAVAGVASRVREGGLDREFALQAFPATI